MITMFYIYATVVCSDGRPREPLFRRSTDPVFLANVYGELKSNPLSEMKYDDKGKLIDYCILENLIFESETIKNK